MINKSGIICHRINKDTKRIEYSVILKNYTQDFIRLLLGRYSYTNPVRLFMMTKFELMLLMLYDIKDLYYFYFKGSKRFNINFIDKIAKKYEVLKKNFIGGFNDYLVTALLTNKYMIPRWEIPKGKKEKGESFIACAKREFSEETKINDVKIFSKKIKPFIEYETFNGFTFKTKYFIGLSNDKSSIINNNINEITMTVWMTIEDISRLNMSTSKKNILCKAHKLLKSIYFL